MIVKDDWNSFDKSFEQLASAMEDFDLAFTTSRKRGSSKNFDIYSIKISELIGDPCSVSKWENKSGFESRNSSETIYNECYGYINAWLTITVQNDKLL